MTMERSPCERLYSSGLRSGQVTSERLLTVKCAAVRVGPPPTAKRHFEI
jgi:hypothetical protein